MLCENCGRKVKLQAEYSRNKNDYCQCGELGTMDMGTETSFTRDEYRLVKIMRKKNKIYK